MRPNCSPLSSTAPTRHFQLLNAVTWKIEMSDIDAHETLPYVYSSTRCPKSTVNIAQIKEGPEEKNARTTKGTPKIHPAPNSNWNILEALINICNQGAWSIGPYWQRPHCTALGIERSNASWGPILVNAIHPEFFRYPYNMGYRPTVPPPKWPRFQQKEWPPTSHITILTMDLDEGTKMKNRK